MALRVAGRRTGALVIVGVVACACSAGPSAPLELGPNRIALADVLFEKPRLLHWEFDLDRAEQVEIHRCMSRLGLAYFNARITRHPSSVVHSHEEDYIERLPRRERRSYELALNGRVRDRSSIALPDHSVLGFYTGGCRATSQIAVYGGVVAAQSVVGYENYFRNEAAKELSEGPQVQRQVAAWRQCVAMRGMSVPEHVDLKFEEAAQDPSHGASAALPSRVAVARGCSAQTDLERVLEMAKEVVTSRMDGEHPNAARALTGTLDDAIVNARRILFAHSTGA
jgi:hypothetical protein